MGYETGSEFWKI